MGRKASRPFRFLSGWLSYNGFEHFVSENWDNGELMEATVKKFTITGRQWNKEVFRDVASLGRFPIRNMFPSIEAIVLRNLDRDVTTKEIHDTLFGMVPLKASSTDKMHA